MFLDYISRLVSSTTHFKANNHSDRHKLPKLLLPVSFNFYTLHILFHSLTQGEIVLIKWIDEKPGSSHKLQNHTADKLSGSTQSRDIMKKLNSSKFRMESFLRAIVLYVLFSMGLQRILLLWLNFAF